MFIILAGMLYFLGITTCCADNEPILPSDDSHMDAVNRALDKAEFSHHNQVTVASPDVMAKANELQFSSETYWAKYDEPKNWSQKGVMSGYNAQYAHRISTDPKAIVNMYSLQAQWAEGKFKQAAYVGPSGIKDRTFDLRGVLGKDFYPASYLRVTGYLGYGYRYLKDNSEGLDPVIDGFTLFGYKRYSHYNYIPLGADFVYQTDRNYSLESNFEYDYMFNGWQVSKLGVVPGYNTLVVDQRSGYGLRASLRLNLYFKYCTAFAESFYRLWDIARSNTKPDPTDPTAQGLNEPKNNTQEFGFRLGLQV